MLLYIRPFATVYLCSKTAFQDKYKLFKELIDSYNASNRNKNKIKYSTLTPDTLPEPEKLENDSIIIFDDILTENQSKIANFFLRGRHKNISCFYLSQSYTKIPKKSGIRENFNYLILFQQDLINLRQIYAEYVNDLTFENFKILCNKCWKEPYGFLVIDVEGKCKYKKKFECRKYK